MINFISSYLYYQYLFSKIPTWYKRFVHNSQIPPHTLKEIKQKIKTEKLTKKKIKEALQKIQKENAFDNKAIWDSYLAKTLPNRYKNIDLEIQKNGKLTAVIVEARKHPHFKVVVENVILNTQHLDVALQVYHGTENENFVKDCLKDYSNIQFINLNVKNLDIEGYNKIILSTNFWNNINSEKALIFQTDTITFKPLDNVFLTYDYIGAPWKKYIQKKNKVDVGNGGLSLRSTKLMLSIIQQNIPRKKGMPEDVYLCQILKQQNFRLAPYTIALAFATENVFNKNAFGCHKIWEETSIDELNKILI